MASEHTDAATAPGGEAPRNGAAEVPAAARSAFVEHLGIAFDDVERGRVRAHLIADERHHQPYGIVHGGVYAAVVETLASIAAALEVWDDGQVVVGVSNQTDFLRAHRDGRLDAVAEAVHVGRSQQLWQVSITRANDGKTVARGQVRLQNLPADAMTQAATG